ncbi:protein TIC 20-II, chloroplastic-like [Tripterygium wilfordii]|uniref:protein TIC 20-II, chloroplastic-like n=1 Tax=Tripterygium wilfordii TaxID=458696 RepID=UPI0018F8293B|nr:protein TIC 20-II, chloroplastic-like [Tripterygium wilfordii]XP_038703834.1 protein TIC 20-II, chloroplastic-like [Tripterygium wilfordii]
MPYSATPASDRLISAVSFTLPFFNSLQVRNPIFSQHREVQRDAGVVLLVVPLMVIRILNPGRTGLVLKAMVWGFNVAFVFTVQYDVLCLWAGLYYFGPGPSLPFVSTF